MKLINTYLKGDRVIWVLVLIISVYSLLSVYSTAGQLAFKYKGGNTEYYLVQRFIMLSLGFGIMYLAHKVKYTLFSKLSVIGMIVTVPLLLITLIMGANLNSATRWLLIPGLGISFQTSDLAKLILVTYVARMLAKNQENIKDFKTGFLPIAIPVVIVCALILPANFSTAAMLFLICIILMFIGRVSIKHIGILTGSAVAGFGLLILLAMAAPKLLPRLDTWKSRVMTFIGTNQEDETTTSGQVSLSKEKYQSDLAKMAIAEGGLLGTGPGNNINKYRLPQGYSDFIYAMIIGEYGSIFGGMIVLLAYLILLYRAVRIATRSEYAFATFLVIGLSLSMVIQAFINMSVAVGIFPVTGQPLPMISMGGTSTLFTGLTLGMILSVSRTLDKKEKENHAAETGNN
ncbi:MAG: FtsW/RodA/SpoVE family cell cycle protein [Flavobacteriales bacterium]|nr:FtsW/RodA/SpoVE family cell cycle protein [Flavobacteriales bacterium]